MSDQPETTQSGSGGGTSGDRMVELMPDGLMREIVNRPAQYTPCRAIKVAPKTTEPALPTDNGWSLYVREIVAGWAYTIFLRLSTDYMLKHLAPQLRRLADYGDRF